MLNRLSFTKSKDKELKIRKTLSTDSGMFGIWDPKSFKMIIDYDTWEKEFLEDNDILQHIIKGTFIPIYFHSDGAFEFEVRIGTKGNVQNLSDREKKYLVVSSECYKFKSNGELCLSGIEYIERNPDENVAHLAISKGEYSAIINIIAWDDEEGMKEEDGTPTPDALPDIIIIMNPIMEEISYRIDVETFTR